MNQTKHDWIIQKIKEWEQRLAEAKTEHERKRAEREIAGYKQWLGKA